MLLLVQLTLLQKNFEGGTLAPLAPPRSAPVGAISKESFDFGDRRSAMRGSGGAP